MPDPTGTIPTATPPATSGAITKEEVTALIGTAVTEATKGLQATIDGLSKQLAEAQKTAPSGGDNKPAGLTEADVKKIITQAQSEHVSSEKVKSAKAAVVKAKLNGIDTLGALLPDTDDETVLNAKADELAKQINLAAPKSDAGGAGKEGGDSVPHQPVDTSKLSPLQLLERGMK